MPDTWIAIAPRDRRRYWWWSGGFAAVIAGIAALGLLPDPSGPLTLTVRWWWIGVVGAGGLVAVGHLVDRTLGRTVLTAEGMRFHTFVSRRSIPWSDVTDIVAAAHSTRGGQWWELRVHRRHGRSLAIPGTFTNRRNDKALCAALDTIRHRWSQAGR